MEYRTSIVLFIVGAVLAISPLAGAQSDDIAVVRKAAEQGSANDQARLGQFYWKGNGVLQDYAQAATWFRKAADQGNAAAQTFLGTMYMRGQGVPKDFTQSAAWLRKASDHGEPVAQNNLGLLYEEGLGVQKDFATAVSWLRKAADQGYATAQDNLGDLYQSGRGVPQNDVQALAWYQKAADQGYVDAKEHLRVLQASGHGLQPEHAQAAQATNSAPSPSDHSTAAAPTTGVSSSESAENGPSLKETLDWMKSKLVDEMITTQFNEVLQPNPKIGIDGEQDDGIRTINYSEVRTSGCNISFTKTTKDVGGYLKREVLVTELVELPIADLQSDKIEVLEKSPGGLFTTVSYNPNYWVVGIGFQQGKKHQSKAVLDGKNVEMSPSVEFRTKQLATRWSKALIHAASLCGAVKQEPF